MINATEMAKPFDKRPAKWLELPSTKEFLMTLQTIRKSDSFIRTIEGRKGGTWMHEDVALEFARWLSPAFAIWCNDRIKELLLTGTASTGTSTDSYTCAEESPIHEENLSELLTEIEGELCESISLLQQKKNRISFLKYRIEHEVPQSAHAPKIQFEQRISHLEQMVNNILSGENGITDTSDQEQVASTHPSHPEKYIPCYSLNEIRIRFRGSMLVRQMARTVSRENGFIVRSSRLFNFLRREGWLLSYPDCYNAPSKESIRRGFILAAQSSTNNSGVKYYTPYITPEGYKFFAQIIKQKGGHL